MSFLVDLVGAFAEGLGKLVKPLENIVPDMDIEEIRKRRRPRRLMILDELEQLEEEERRNAHWDQ
jgi:hypothetical protein